MERRAQRVGAASLWAVMLIAWLNKRDRNAAENTLLERLVYSKRRWAPAATDRGIASAWYDALCASLGSIPSERQVAVMVWAAVSAWTDASDDGGPWERIVDAAEAVARQLDDGELVAREADALATVGRLLLEQPAAQARSTKFDLRGGLLTLDVPLSEDDRRILDAARPAL